MPCSQRDFSPLKLFYSGATKFEKEEKAKIDNSHALMQTVLISQWQLEQKCL